MIVMEIPCSGGLQNSFIVKWDTKNYGSSFYILKECLGKKKYICKLNMCTGFFLKKKKQIYAFPEL